MKNIFFKKTLLIIFIYFIKIHCIFAVGICTHSPATLHLTAGGPPQTVTYNCNGMDGLPPSRPFLLKFNAADGIQTIPIMSFGYPYRIMISATNAGNYSLPIIDCSVGGSWNRFPDPNPLQINVTPPEPTYPQITAGSLICHSTSIAVNTISDCTILYTNTGNGAATNVLITPSANAGTVGSITGCSTLIAANSSCTAHFIYTAPAFIPFVNPVSINVTYEDDQKESVAIESTEIGINNGLSAAKTVSLTLNQGSVKGGQTITIKGTSGINPSVTFDGHVAIILSSSNTEITLKTPGNAYIGGSGGKAVAIVITTSNGVTTLPNAYTYVGLNDPYEGGVIFHLNKSGNPGGIIVSSSDYPSNSNTFINWNQAATYCAHYLGGGYHNWHLPNCAKKASHGTITGEAALLYNNGTPYAGISTQNHYWGASKTTTHSGTDHSLAWIENFEEGTQFSAKKMTNMNALFVRCVRNFHH